MAVALSEPCRVGVRPRLLALIRDKAVAGVADALATSGVMFLVQLALIWFAAKEDYGAYSLLMSYVLAGQAALSAVFGAPLITSASAMADSERDAALASATRWHLFATFALAVAAALIFIFAMPRLGIGEVVATSAAFIGLALRDVQRVNWSIELRLDRALANSLSFGALVFATLFLAYLGTGALSSTTAMAAIAASALATAALPLLRRMMRGRAGRAAVIATAAHARWTLPGVFVIWIQNNLYLTILAVMLGLSAVAEVSAARMLVVPVLLATGALIRLNQVESGGLLAQGRGREALIASRRRAARYLVAGLVLAALAASAASSPLAAMLPADYPDLLGFAALWFAFAGVAAARGALSSLMQAAGLYRSLLVANLATIPVAIGGLVILIPAIGAAGAVIPLIAAEGLFAAMLLLLMNRHFSVCATRNADSLAQESGRVMEAAFRLDD